MKSSIVLCYEINKLAHLFTYLITYPLTFSTDCVSLWGEIPLIIVMSRCGWWRATEGGSRQSDLQRGRSLYSGNTLSHRFVRVLQCLHCAATNTVGHQRQKSAQRVYYGVLVYVCVRLRVSHIHGVATVICDSTAPSWTS